ncbi:hypothetical protein Goshw_018578, partial [Gossypium schwendimanii]|nr:hypothetical protein [Gossypium schwendimanii]
VQRVEFESLLVVCFSCGCYGHLKELCPSIVQDLNSDGGKVKALISIVKGSALVDVEKPLGPWMVVERKSWRNQKDSQNQKTKLLDMGLGKSKFGALVTLEKDIASVNEKQHRVFKESKG